MKSVSQPGNKLCIIVNRKNLLTHAAVCVCVCDLACVYVCVLRFGCVTVVSLKDILCVARATY